MILVALVLIKLNRERQTKVLIKLCDYDAGWSSLLLLTCNKTRFFLATKDMTDVSNDEGAADLEQFLKSCLTR